MQIAAPTPISTPRKGANVIASLLVVALAAYAVRQLSMAFKVPLIFDDSYMFYRYAMNIRHGLGMSWNLDGVHTYGETSLLWGVVILLLTYLPLSIPHLLIFGSWVCGAGAVFAMAWAVAQNAQSGLMKSTWRVLPMVAIPLAISPIYVANSLTGMETMLAAMLLSIFVGLALSWESGHLQPHWLSLAAIALFLTRPESALPVLLLPFLMVLFGRGSKRGFLIFAGLLFIGILLDLLVCKIYFGTPLPLSFYMKSGHAYEGYHRTLHPLSNALEMFANCGLFLAVILMWTRRSEWKMVLSFLIPMLLTFAYLCTVTQIMGWKARYYVPYFAFFVVPALLLVDKRVEDSEKGRANAWSGNTALALGCGAISLVFIVPAVRGPGVIGLLEAADMSLERRPYVYDPVSIEMAARKPLPRKVWFDNIHGLGDVLLAPLPSGATIAASEVGYLGAADLHGNVIDIAGLNDNQIALHGFNMDALLKRAPDIIWMPHSDYTYQLGVMLTDPGLLSQYDFYAGVADYGIALRKDSPIRPQIDRQMAILWRDFYPGYKMQDYKVTSTSWSGRKYKPTPEQDKQAKKNGSYGAGQ
jgi:hypothetical protein